MTDGFDGTLDALIEAQTSPFSVSLVYDSIHDVHDNKAPFVPKSVWTWSDVVAIAELTVVIGLPSVACKSGNIRNAQERAEQQYEVGGQTFHAVSVKIIFRAATRNGLCCSRWCASGHTFSGMIMYVIGITLTIFR